jgi:predicted transcriptional regulator
MPNKGYKHLTDTQIEQCKSWYKDGLGVKKIALRLGCGKSTVSRHVFKKNRKVQPMGRPKAITKPMLRKLLKKLTELQKKAKGNYDVTAAMVKKGARCKAHTKRIREAFRANGKPFRKLREKPILEAADLKQRSEFGKRYGKKTKKGWNRKPHGIIDNKSFPLVLDCKGRSAVARRSVRAAYRSGADAVRADLVKPKNSTVQFARRVMVTAAVIKGRIRMWHVTPGRWNAERAAEMHMA